MFHNVLNTIVLPVLEAQAQQISWLDLPDFLQNANAWKPTAPIQMVVFLIELQKTMADVLAEKLS